jgi:hypothetical protein
MSVDVELWASQITSVVKKRCPCSPVKMKENHNIWLCGVVILSRDVRWVLTGPADVRVTL